MPCRSEVGILVGSPVQRLTGLVGKGRLVMDADGCDAGTGPRHGISSAHCIWPSKPKSLAIFR